MSPQSPIGAFRANLGSKARLSTDASRRSSPNPYSPVLRLTFAAILLTALGLTIAFTRSGHGSDVAILIVAIACVCTFGALPVLMGNRRKKPVQQNRITLPRKGPGASDS
jgi:hypothetical protein